MMAKCFPLLIVNTAVCCEKVNEVHFMKKKKKKRWYFPSMPSPGTRSESPCAHAVAQCEYFSGEKNGGMMR